MGDGMKKLEMFSSFFCGYQRELILETRERKIAWSLLFFFYQLGQIFILILLEMAVSDPITPELLPDLIIQK